METLIQNGYLVNPEAWNREIAEKLAAYEDIPNLSEQQWQVISYIRDYYEDFKKLPPIYKVCGAANLKLVEICKLFPNGHMRSAYRIAGLPVELWA